MDALWEKHNLVQKTQFRKDFRLRKLIKRNQKLFNKERTKLISTVHFLQCKKWVFIGKNYISKDTCPQSGRCNGELAFTDFGLHI